MLNQISPNFKGCYKVTMPNVKDYIETKPIDRNKFEKQNLVGLSKSLKIRKINKDILGTRFYVDSENFSLVIDN